MRRTAPAVLILAFAAAASAASAASPTPPHPFTPVMEPTAKQRVAESHAFYVKLSGDGWYIGDPAFASAAVPIAGDAGQPYYTCPMAAGMHDKGDRSADVVDEHGNVLMTLRGKGIDRDVVALLKNADGFVPHLHQSAQAALAKARTLVEKHHEREASAILAPIARLDGWPEAHEAGELLARIPH